MRCHGSAGRSGTHHHQPSLAGVILILLTGGLAGCAAYPHTPYPPRVSPALGELRDDHAAVRLFYATDRRPTGLAEPSLCYGVERAPDPHYGTCEVSIPRKHGRGRLETPPPFVRARPDRHVALMSLSPAMANDAFLEELRTQVSHSPHRDVFVFIHGYYTSFHDAARLTAQIAHDIDLEGVAVAYSWPSEAWLIGYLIDGVNAEWTVPHLVEFLNLLADESGAARIHLMAHSMGTRALVRALKEFVRDHPERNPPAFDQIVLAAADLDVEIFERDYAPYVVRAGQRLTIYVSSADWALGGSRRVHKYARLGQTGPIHATAAWSDRVDVIDATAVDKGIVGHVYYHRSPTFLDDLRGVLHGTDPAARGLSAEERFFQLVKPEAVPD